MNAIENIDDLIYKFIDHIKTTTAIMPITNSNHEYN